MELKIKGTITKILEAESGTSKAGKEWNKLDFLIETKDAYPKIVCFTLFGDKTDIMQYQKVGNLVDVYFNLESREYNGKYFHNINAWKITKLETEIVDAENEAPPLEEDNNIPF